MKVKVIYFLVFLIIYLEMIFKFIVLKSAKVMDVAYTLLFSIQIILVLNLLCNAFKPKVSKVILMITTIVLTIYFMFQSVFYNLFSVPFSFMTLGLAENALDFTEMVKDAIIQNGFILILLSIPFWMLLFLQKKIDFVPFRKEQIAMRIAGIAFFLLILLGVIQIDQKGIYSTYNLFYNLNAQEKNMERFGLINSTVIDLTRTITGFEENLVLEVNSNEIEQTPFVIYNSELEPKVFTEKTSYMNILPTLANLFNLDYDPRFYLGEDLFSEDFSDRVVFADSSWEDAIARYDAGSGTITYFGDETYSTRELQAINTEIYQKKEMSKLAIMNNYFDYLEKKLEDKKGEISEDYEETDDSGISSQE